MSREVEEEIESLLFGLSYSDIATLNKKGEAMIEVKDIKKDKAKTILLYLQNGYWACPF